MRYILIIAALMMSVNTFAKEYNVLDFGVKGDSSTINTKAIQMAIDAVSKAKGKLVFPAGNYISGTIFLKSNVHIELQEGAVLYGSVDLNDYPDIEHGMYVWAYAHHAFVYANGQENFSITGKGRIDGSGEHPAFSLMRESDEHMHRPYMVQLINCKNIRIDGIELYNPAFWLHHYLNCEDLFINGIKVFSHVAANNDGMDIDDCKNVVVSNCIIFCDDDAFCFKSTTRKGCDNVTITNSVVQTNANAIKFGTDSHSAFRNININNIVINEPRKDRETFFNTLQGICAIAIESVDGSIMENINFSNITIKNVDTPFYIKLGDRLRKSHPDDPDKQIGTCKNFTFSNIIVTGVSPYASHISGMPGYPVENIMFDNIIYKTAGYTEHNPDELLDVPEKSRNYPSPEIYGISPSYAFYVRHAKNIGFRNIKFFTEGADSRHAIVMDDVQGIRLSEVDFHSEGNPSAVRLINSSDAMINMNKVHQPTDALLQIEGKESVDIMVNGNHTRKAKSTVKMSPEIDKEEVKIINNWE